MASSASRQSVISYNSALLLKITVLSRGVPKRIADHAGLNAAGLGCQQQRLEFLRRPFVLVSSEVLSSDLPTLLVRKAKPNTATPAIVIPRIATAGIESGRLSAESIVGPPGDIQADLTSNVLREDACIAPGRANSCGNSIRSC